MRVEKMAYLLLHIGLLVTAIIGLMVGAQFFSPAQIWQAFSGQNGTVLNTVLSFRLPRIIAAMLCGGMLAMAGALSQSVFRNRLADPTILGVTSAGELLVLLGGLLLPAFGLEKLLLAFIGGCLAFALLANRRTMQHPYQLIIVGVALNLTFEGLQQLFTKGISVGGSLGFNGMTWATVIQLLITGCVGLILALLLAPWANDLKLSDDQLTTVGVPVIAIRLSLLGLVVYLSASVVSVVGTIPFIGIIIPNLARRFVGHDYLTILPFSMLSGAWLLLVVDTIGRTVMLPSEIAASTIMMILGGPFLVWLIQREAQHGISSR